MLDIPANSGQQFWIFLQVFVRVSCLVAVAPVFGAREVPTPLKIALSFLISIVLFPVAAPTLAASKLPETFYDLAAPIASQAAIGLMMGFVVSLVLVAVQFAGTILDLQVGFSLAQTLNPALGTLVTPIAQFEYLYALLIFLLANGHYLLLGALAHSFAMLPASSVHLASAAFMRFFADATFATLVSGLSIAAPAAGVLVVIDISLAFLARAVPQMNVFFVGLPVKVLAGLLLLVVILPVTAAVVGQMVAGSQANLLAAFHGLLT